MPNSKCAAAFCNNRRVDVRKRKLALIFHAFPADEALRSRWMAFCRRGVDWTPFKTDAVCSAHFRHEDYQMAHSPLLKLSKNLRRLRVDAVPSVREGMVVTISKKQKLEELVRQQRLEELYRQNNPCAEPSTDFDHTYSGVTVAEELRVQFFAHSGVENGMKMKLKSLIFSCRMNRPCWRRLSIGYRSVTLLRMLWGTTTWFVYLCM